MSVLGCDVATQLFAEHYKREVRNRALTLLDYANLIAGYFSVSPTKIRLTGLQSTEKDAGQMFAYIVYQFGFTDRQTADYLGVSRTTARTGRLKMQYRIDYELKLSASECQILLIIYKELFGDMLQKEIKEKAAEFEKALLAPLVNCCWYDHPKKRWLQGYWAGLEEIGGKIIIKINKGSRFAGSPQEIDSRVILELKKK